MKTFKRPKVEDYDFQPHGYICDMVKYCDKLEIQRNELLEACIEFVRKCESGEARSIKSYKQMKKAINKAL